MTRTIEVDAQVEHGRVVIELPADVPDGPLHLVVTMDSPPAPKPSSNADWLDQLQPISPGVWPADAPFNREDLYDDGC